LLERNVGLSNVAIADDRVVGAVLCSHDGRIGYLTHLVVDKEYRRMGIGRQLVGRSVYALMGQGVSECLLLMMKETKVAVNFCRSVDPAGRVSLVMMAPR
jgi:ribosomal protein S18 acetylase RimI-like enzyme